MRAITPHRRSALFVLTLLAAGAAGTVQAQGAESPAGDPAEPRLVVAGFLAMARDDFMGIGASVALLDGTGGWVGRWAFLEEFRIFGPDPLLSVWDVSVQRAWIQRDGILRATASAGPALVGGMSRGRYLRSDGGWFGTSYYEEEPFLTVGAAGAFEITAAFLPFLGVGIEVSGLANAERSYVALAMRISGGSLR